MAAGWLFLGVFLTVASCFALVTLRVGLTRYLHHVVRLCGRVVLRLQGIRLRVIHPERLAQIKPRVVATNHSSQLDIFVFAAVFPPHGTGVIKRELLLVPFLGWFIFAFGMLLIDRKNPERAHRSLTRAAGLVQERSATVVIAPEGTRSRDGSLGPFKMGLFHLVLAAHTPIQPAIIRGADACLPVGAIVARPGVVELELLPEVSTADYHPGNLAEKRDELRRLFLEQLGGRPAE